MPANSFKKETNNNVLLDEHVAKIMVAFDSKEDEAHFAKSVENAAIAANDYNLLLVAMWKPKTPAR